MYYHTSVVICRLIACTLLIPRAALSMNWSYPSSGVVSHRGAAAASSYTTRRLGSSWPLWFLFTSFFQTLSWFKKSYLAWILISSKSIYSSCIFWCTPILQSLLHHYIWDPKQCRENVLIFKPNVTRMSRECCQLWPNVARMSRECRQLWPNVARMSRSLAQCRKHVTSFCPMSRECRELSPNVARMSRALTWCRELWPDVARMLWALAQCRENVASFDPMLRECRELWPNVARMSRALSWCRKNVESFDPMLREYRELWPNVASFDRGSSPKLGLF